MIRRLNGDHAVRTRKADTKEIVRRCHAAGMNDLEAARITGISNQTFFRVRRQLALPANGDGGQSPPRSGA